MTATVTQFDPALFRQMAEQNGIIQSSELHDYGYFNHRRFLPNHDSPNHDSPNHDRPNHDRGYLFFLRLPTI